jgi:hypothetical protein
MKFHIRCKRGKQNLYLRDSQQTGGFTWVSDYCDRALFPRETADRVARDQRARYPAAPAPEVIPEPKKDAQ